MGMFDEILIPCPDCNGLIYKQSKSGQCVLGTYHFSNAPKDALAGLLKEDEITCEHCEAEITIDAKFFVVSNSSKYNKY